MKDNLKFKVFFWGILIFLLSSLPLPSIARQTDKLKAKEKSSAFLKPAEYIIGIEDVLSISIWPSEDFPKEVTVRIDGNISFPLIGKIKADGLTPSLLEKEIEKRLSEYIKDPWVTVRVKEYKSKKVMLLGEIQGGPKIYSLRERVNILELLILLGALTDKADISKIEVTREDGEVIYVNLNNILYSQKTEDRGRESPQSIVHSPQRTEEREEVGSKKWEVGSEETEEREKREEADDENIVIEPGDTIFIPRVVEEKVFVLGAVNRPGMVYIKKEGLTVFEALAEAGTLSAGAEASSVKVIRGDIENPQIIRVNLDEVMHKGDLKENITLKPDDIVYVPGKRKAFIERVNKVIAQITPSLGLIYIQPFLKKLAE